MHGGDSGDDEKFSTMHQNHYYLGGNVFASVCWLVRLSVSRITRKVTDEFPRGFLKGKTLRQKVIDCNFEGYLHLNA